MALDKERRKNQNFGELIAKTNTLQMYSALSGFDFRLAEAAYDLGATKGVVLRRMGTLGLFPPNGASHRSLPL